MEKNVDVLVIGTGTAGQTAAYDLVAEGLQVAVAEKSDEPGGICALYGCQAKKYFYELTELVAKSKHLANLGVVSPPEVSWQQIRAAKDNFTAKIPENTVLNLKGNGITYLEGAARFISPDQVQVGNDVLSPANVVLAVGAKPRELSFEGAELLATSNDFLGLETLPEKLVFVGGGFISFEFAHFAARLGAKEITILESHDRPLGPFDEEMVGLLVEASAAEGITIKTSVQVDKVARQESGYQVHFQGGESIVADLVVHGAGRSADLEGLGLETAGVEFDNSGVKVDGFMRTSNSKVFAVGDCAATLQLARVADWEGHQAAAVIAGEEFGEEPDPLDYSSVPAVLFTYPQLAMVGQTEQELEAKGIKYWKSSDKNLSWPNYKRIGMKQAAYKILVGDDSKILGAHFLSDNGSGMANTFKQAMLDGKTATELYQSSVITPYPSRESDMVYMLDSLRE